MSLGVIGIDDLIIVGVIAYSAYQINKTVKDIRDAKRKARAAHLAQIQRFIARFETEKAQASAAQAKVVSALPYIAGGLVVAGIAWAATPPKRSG